MECTCQECINMCLHSPCWPLPKESQVLMNLGLANKLMLDYWAGDYIEILSPALVGYSHQKAPFWPIGRCIFLDKQFRCEIHAYKPLEGRIVLHGETKHDNIHKRIAMLWKTQHGFDAINRWKELVNYRYY